MHTEVVTLLTPHIMDTGRAKNMYKTTFFNSGQLYHLKIYIYFVLFILLHVKYA